MTTEPISDTSQPTFEMPDYAARTLQNMTQYIVPHFDARRVRFLEIGVQEERSAIHAMETVCRNPDSTYLGLDKWELWADPLATSAAQVRCRETAHRNLVKYGDKARLYQGGLFDYLQQDSDPGSFDCVYIDGDHTFEACLADSLGCWPLLATGGVLFWDDVGVIQHRQKWQKPQ